MSAIKKVMIIDDDEINNFICLKNIKDAQFAEDAQYYLRGQEALDHLQIGIDEDPGLLPDIIFLDINMPKMNAWEFLERYNEMHPKFPRKVKLFILSSSVYRKDIDRSALYDVVTDYIIKPLSKEKLLRIKEKFFTSSLK